MTFHALLAGAGLAAAGMILYGPFDRPSGAPTPAIRGEQYAARMALIRERSIAKEKVLAELVAGTETLAGAVRACEDIDRSYPTGGPTRASIMGPDRYGYRSAVVLADAAAGSVRFDPRYAAVSARLRDELRDLARSGELDDLVPADDGAGP